MLVSNGTQTVEIDKIGPNPATNKQWIEKSIRISDFISLTSTMQFFFNTSDEDPNINITEAALDRFFIVEAAVLNVEEVKSQLKIYPNPFDNKFTIEGYANEAEYEIHSMSGELVQKGELVKGMTIIDLDHVKRGVYFLHLSDEVHKLIKMD